MIRIGIDQLGSQPILDGALVSSEESAPQSPLFQKLEEAKLQAGKIVDAVGEGLLQLGIRDAVSDRDRAIREVIKSVQIYAPKKSTAVTIHAESKTPEMAQALAAAIITGFLDRHFSVSRTEGSHEFFKAQTQSVESQLNAAMLKRSQFMQQSKVVSANDMRRILTDQPSLRASDGVDRCRCSFCYCLQGFQADYDLVVVDLPPASRPDRTHGIIEYLDYVIVVFESNRTDETRAKRLLQMFSSDNQTMGIVLNKTRNYVPSFLSRFLS